MCEQLYEISEKNNSELAHLMNKNVIHSEDNYPAKVFVIERIISLLLIFNGNFKVKVYNPLSLPFTSAQISNDKNILIILDALKLSFTETNISEYLEVYLNIRSNLLKR